MKKQRSKPMAAKCIRKRFSKGSLTTNETVEATNVMGNISFNGNIDVKGKGHANGTSCNRRDPSQWQQNMTEEG